MFCTKMSLVLVIFILAQRSSLSAFSKYLAALTYVAISVLSAGTLMKFGFNIFSLAHSLTSTESNVLSFQLDLCLYKRKCT